MNSLHPAFVSSLIWAVLLAFVLPASAQMPDKATVFLAHAHMDDESIWPGGVLPYYSQVKNIPVTLYSAVTRAGNGSYPIMANGRSRVADLRRAVDVYAGQSLESGVFSALGHYTSGNITMVEGGFTDTGCCGADPTDTWSTAGDNSSWGTSPAVSQLTPGFGNMFGMSDARWAAAWGMAREIRRFRPEVVVSAHDLEGDYGHSNHTSIAIAAIDAYDMAADPAVNIEGLAVWQAKKLYVRGDSYDNRDTLLWPDLSSAFPDFASDGGINSLFHDYFEDPSIDSQTPREVGNDGLDQHIAWKTHLPGGHDVTTIYDPNTVRPGNHSEWWTLYRSTVGPDTPTGPFTIAGDYTETVYDGWARGDFFENIPIVIQGWNDVVGDLNQDGFVDGADAIAFQAGWHMAGTGLSALDRYMQGDLNLSGFTDLADAFILHDALVDAGSSITMQQVLGGAVPEPASWMLAVLGIACLGSMRRKSQSE